MALPTLEARDTSNLTEQVKGSKDVQKTLLSIYKDLHINHTKEITKPIQLILDSMENIEAEIKNIQK